MKKLILFLMGAGLLVSGCNLPLTPAAGTEGAPGVTASPGTDGPGATAAPGEPTIPSSPFPQPDPITSEQPVEIRWVQAVSAAVLWGVGGVGDGADRVLRSDDGGRVWRDVSPPHAADDRGSAHFADDRTGWVVFSSPENGVRGVWTTRDGGQTWTESVIPPVSAEDMPGMQPRGPVFFHAADPDHAWILFDLGAGAGHAYAGLYRTTNGGDSWELMHAPGMPGDSIDTCCQSGMAFRDAAGLITYSPGPDPRVRVSWSTDAGATWQDLLLPAPPAAQLEAEYFSGLNCSTGSPHLFSALEAVVTVECQTPDIPYGFFYETGDGGQTWNIYSFPEGRLSFISRETILALGSTLYLSEDGGATWRIMSSVTWRGQFSFVTARLGWAVAESGVPDTDSYEIAFVRMEDGENWEIMVPVVGPW